VLELSGDDDVCSTTLALGRDCDGSFSRGHRLAESIG
jgi:hypothetical protein